MDGKWAADQQPPWTACCQNHLTHICICTWLIWEKPWVVLFFHCIICVQQNFFNLLHFRCVEYCPDMNLVVTGSWDTTLKLWDPRQSRDTGTYQQNYKVNISSSQQNYKLNIHSSRENYKLNIPTCQQQNFKQNAPMHQQKILGHIAQFLFKPLCVIVFLTESFPYWVD